MTIDRKIDDFIQWMRTRGVNLNNDWISLQQIPEIGGYGIFANRAFRNGEKILELPIEALITPTTVMNNPETARILRSSGVEFTPYEALALFIHVESSKAGSAYRPYLNILPQSFDTPLAGGLALDDKDLPSASRDIWKKQRDEIKELMPKFEKAIPGITRDQVLWAWHVVNTRSICIDDSVKKGVLNNSDDDNVALIPLVDMLNHDPVNNCEPRLRKDTYVLECTKSINEGDQIYVTYGPHGNDKLWFEYGFTLEDNPLNSVPISMDLFIHLAVAAAKAMKMGISEEVKEVLREKDLNCTLYASNGNVLSTWFKHSVRILFLKHHEIKFNLDKNIYGEVEDDLNEKIWKLSRDIITTLRANLKSRHDGAADHAKFLWMDRLDIIDSLLENPDSFYL